MQIPVLIERLGKKRFRARLGEPLVLAAEGDTEQAAFDKLQALVQQRLSNGRRLTALDVGTHPLAKWAGSWDPNDPLIKKWKKAVAAYRRKVDRRRT